MADKSIEDLANLLFSWDTGVLNELMPGYISEPIDGIAFEDTYKFYFARHCDDNRFNKPLFNLEQSRFLVKEFFKRDPGFREALRKNAGAAQNFHHEIFNFLLTMKDV